MLLNASDSTLEQVKNPFQFQISWSLQDVCACQGPIVPKPTDIIRTVQVHIQQRRFLVRRIHSHLSAYMLSRTVLVQYRREVVDFYAPRRKSELADRSSCPRSSCDRCQLNGRRAYATTPTREYPYTHATTYIQLSAASQFKVIICEQRLGKTTCIRSYMQYVLGLIALSVKYSPTSCLRPFA